jgi:enamine deaminase RidA (YjgF/YER057c/UK114 family)
MRLRSFNWQGERFVYLNVEATPGAPLAAQGREVFARADAALKPFGLSLSQNVVRTRILGRTGEARTEGSNARTAALTGKARAAGSSYISPPHLGSAADIGIDLFAMAAPAAGAARMVTEHAPVQSFIRHLVWGPMVFLAGMTCETQPTLGAQVADILPRAGALLAETGCGWKDVVRVSLFLHRSERPDALLGDVAKVAPVPLEHAEIEQVDGFSRPVKLVELEITARK